MWNRNANLECYEQSGHRIAEESPKNCIAKVMTMMEHSRKSNQRYEFKNE